MLPNNSGDLYLQVRGKGSKPSRQTEETVRRTGQLEVRASYLMSELLSSPIPQETLPRSPEPISKSGENKFEEQEHRGGLLQTKL